MLRKRTYFGAIIINGDLVVPVGVLSVQQVCQGGLNIDDELQGLL
jgi:hypothetical protein